ncbi:hypothetical protein VMCG_07521 [Cytospora schulzeri]|uniref:FAD-binding domain-containing protein n=1 Tax=Cytospora schulzeri TaxID=448051 RepID=A0A423W1R9_9PEZI|nr:hypothetical protein VMCG_07521 [Valsa malicola]
MTFPRVAIIGAGPVGTTLARLLLLQTPSTSVTIFEGEASPNYRTQGGTLDLHTATGLAALKEAGLWDEFLKHARYDGESLLMTDKNLKAFMQVKPSSSPEEKSYFGGQRPEIDRAALRQLLVESLPSEMIQWGHRLKEVRPGPDPKSNELVFTLPDGSTTTKSGFDLIVGADGAWSKVRSVLTEIKPKFAGIGHQSFEIPDAANTAPEVYRTVNRGSVFSHADGLKTSIQQMGDGSLLVAVSFRTDDGDWFHNCPYDAFDLEEAKGAALARLDGWHPVIREAVSKARGRTVPRSFYMLPVGVRFEHRAGFTLVGDAAHLMTPFAGEGVNVGMEDARRLARAVVAAGGGEDPVVRLDGEVAAFEGDMFTRAGEFAELTESLMKTWFFTEDCPRSVYPSAMATHASFHAPRPLKSLALQSPVGAAAAAADEAELAGATTAADVWATEEATAEGVDETAATTAELELELESESEELSMAGTVIFSMTH